MVKRGGRTGADKRESCKKSSRILSASSRGQRALRITFRVNTYGQY